MALTLAQYGVWPSKLGTGETKTSYTGKYYTWLSGTNTEKTYAIRVEWYVAKKGTEYYKIYFKSYFVIKVGWSTNFSGKYTLNINNASTPFKKDIAFSAAGLNPTTGSKNPSGTVTNWAYYLIATDTYTIKRSTTPSIGLNGKGFKITSVALTTTLNATLGGKRFTNVTASTASHSGGSTLPQTLPALVTATAAQIVGLSATGGYKSISVQWSTDIAIAGNPQYSIDGGTTYKTASSGSGENHGSFSITGLNPGTKYTVRLKVVHDNLSTTKDATAVSTYTQPTISLSSTAVSIGINDTSKGVVVNITNPGSFCFLKAKVCLSSDDTALSNEVTVSAGSNTINLNLTTVKNKISSSGKFYVLLRSFTDSGFSNSAYPNIKSAEGTITRDYSAANIVFTDSNFTVTSSTSGTAINGGTLGNRLLIRSVSQVKVRVSALATTSAGSLTHIVEIKNSSNQVIKTQSITNTNEINLGTITAAGTYSAVLTISNAAYNKTKVVTISDIYVSEYSKPSIYGTISKTSTVNTFLMTVSAQYSTIKNSSGTNVNLLNVFKWEYKLSSATAWTAGGDFSTSSFALYGTTYQLSNLTQNITNLNTSSNYNFRFTIKDSINTITYEANSTEAGSILRILENGQIGIGASPDTTDTSVLLTIGKTAKANVFKASSFDNISLAEEKDEIKLFVEDVENIIQNTDVYNYKYKHDIEEGIDNEKIGFIIGDGYNTYSGIMNKDKNAIDLYSCIGVLWKSQQKIYEELTKLKEKIQSN